MNVSKLTSNNFRPFGRLIEYPNKHLKGNSRNLWRIVLTEDKPTGWRIAYLIVRDKTLRRLEAHPNTYESFEPVRGRSLLFVAQKKDLKVLKCFELTGPIILKKNIWHGIITLTPECEIKITENAKVKCVYWPLNFKLGKNSLEKI